MKIKKIVLEATREGKTTEIVISENSQVTRPKNPENLIKL